MRIIKEDINPEKDKFEQVFAIRDIKKYFETMKFQKGNATDTIDNPINSIVLEANPANLTINFGDFGHIHLNGKELSAFVKGLNELCEKMPSMLKEK